MRKALFWTVLASEVSHVFCCVIPSFISVLSLLAGLGLVATLPAGFAAFHDIMHEYEVPMIVFSGAILALGWGLHKLSARVDCHNTGCVHEPCGPVKQKSSRLLMVATALFAVNVSVYFLFHAGSAVPQAVTAEHSDHQH